MLAKFLTPVHGSTTQHVGVRKFKADTPDRCASDQPFETMSTSWHIPACRLSQVLQSHTTSWILFVLCRITCLPIRPLVLYLRRPLHFIQTAGAVVSDVTELSFEDLASSQLNCLVPKPLDCPLPSPLLTARPAWRTHQRDPELRIRILLRRGNDCTAAVETALKRILQRCCGGVPLGICSIARKRVAGPTGVPFSGDSHCGYGAEFCTATPCSHVSRFAEARPAFTQASPCRRDVLHGEGRISPATPRSQTNEQPSRGQPQEAMQT